MRIFVREGKGNKERYTILPKQSLEMLRTYWSKYKYVREMVITEEPLIKTTTLKIKRHEELKKVLGK